MYEALETARDLAGIVATLWSVLMAAAVYSHVAQGGSPTAWTGRMTAAERWTQTAVAAYGVAWLLHTFT